MKIRHIRPFSTSKNIGLEYNNTINDLPDDCYVCLTDGDVMFLTPEWGNQIEAIIKANPDYDLITCMTNRIGLPDCLINSEFYEDGMIGHIKTAMNRWSLHGTELKQTDVAPGMLMIFHKSLWHKHKFTEKNIKFDRQFSRDVISGGGKIGVAQGLYIFHLYRWGHKDPQSYKKHLL